MMATLHRNLTVVHPYGNDLVYIRKDIFCEEQRLRLDMQEKLAIADETIITLEQLLLRALSELQKAKEENNKHMTVYGTLEAGIQPVIMTWSLS